MGVIYMNNVSDVIVKYNSKVVGYLKQLDAKRVAFRYSNEWIENGFSISPLSLPLTDKVYISNYEKYNSYVGSFDIPYVPGSLFQEKL